MEINKISQKLLAEGWTKDRTPPGMRSWNDFYGGWVYLYSGRRDAVFESPCGILWKREDLSIGGMCAFMGVVWSEENDNMVTLCPHYTRDYRCELNAPEWEDHPFRTGPDEYMRNCAVHETDRKWDYGQSGKKVLDELERIKSEKWTEFCRKYRDRACRWQSHYNRKTQTWSMAYDPRTCSLHACQYCSVLHREVSRKKVNVYYDRKEVRVKKGEGLFEDEKTVTILKGIKLLPRPVSETIAEAIVRRCRDSIQRTVELNSSWRVFMGEIESVEVINLRAGRTEARDLLQDLQDVANGIEVTHEIDMQNEKAAAKRESREKRKAEKERKSKDAIRQKVLNGDVKPSYETSYRYQLGNEEYEKAVREREDKAAGVGEQTTLFETEGAV